MGKVGLASGVGACTFSLFAKLSVAWFVDQVQVWTLLLEAELQMGPDAGRAVGSALDDSVPASFL